MEVSKIKIDEIDNQILKILSENSRVKLKTIAEKVHLSQPSTKERILKLEKKGIIARYTIDINHSKLGYNLHVFLFFSLKSPSQHNFMRIMQKWESHFIQQCQSSGDVCFIVEGRFKSQEELTNFIHEVSKYAYCKVFDILRGSNQNIRFTTWFEAEPNNHSIIQG